MTCPSGHRCCDCDRERAAFRDTLDRMRVALRRRAPEILWVEEHRETTLVEVEERASSGGLVPKGPLSPPGTGMAATLIRGLDVFVGEDGATRAAEWLASLRVVVSQRPEIGPDGHPRRVREVLVMNAEVCKVLGSCPPERREATIRELVETHAKSFWAAMAPSSNEGWRGAIHWQPLRSRAVAEAAEASLELEADRVFANLSGHSPAQGFNS